MNRVISVFKDPFPDGSQVVTYEPRVYFVSNKKETYTYKLTRSDRRQLDGNLKKFYLTVKNTLI